MYITGETRRSLGAAIVLGICLILGLAAAGYFVGEGAVRLKSNSRLIAVKGVAEKEVKADRAVWTLSLRQVSHNFKEAHAKINADREKTITFLRRRDFKEEEIVRQPTTTKIERQIVTIHDKEGQEYHRMQSVERFRYLVTTFIMVNTSDVDRVRTALGATEELIKLGVVLDGERDGNTANPRYIISSYSAIQPQLFAEATRNAFTTAQQLATSSGVLLGPIHSANQGMMQVLGSDGNEESAPYALTSAITKRVRVVNTFEFSLQ